MTEHVRADADAIVIRGEDGIRASEVVVGAATDVGRLRTINEDGYLAIAPAFVVVDGMGGHAAGRMATQVALDSLYSLAGAIITDIDTVVRAVVAAQEAIIAIPSHAAYLGGGIADSGVPDLYSVPVAARDRLLICSDGLSDELDDEAIATVLAAGCTAQRTAELLVAASLEGGGHDNTTAVVVDALQVPDLPSTAHTSHPGGASSQGAQ